MKNRDDRWYHKLGCGHIRMIKLKDNNIVYKETEVYCKKCDTFQVVLGKAER